MHIGGLQVLCDDDDAEGLSLILVSAILVLL